MNTRTSFQVTGLLANRHIQSMLASSKLRRHLKSKDYTDLIANEAEYILKAGTDIRLHCYYSKYTSTKSPKNNNKLVILIHGWEGSAESTYLLSAASSLYNAGFSVLRLHLRDHGPSSYLNTELFHAARLEEVLKAMQDIQSRFQYDENYLVGFSLGGNFALRVRQEAKNYALKLNHIVAISPVFSPSETMAALETGTLIYRKYFIKKWKRALRNKQSNFPDKYDFSDLLASDSLKDMTEILIKAHTPFHSVKEYFNSYTLNPDVIEHSNIKTDVILAADDPVIPITGSHGFSSSDTFRLRIFNKGGHCGFIHNWRFESWVDKELLSLFT
jgi:predicted alpha/beta-fold hydrolase